MLGADLDSLEQEYSQHLVDTVRSHGSMEQWRLEELPCAPAVNRLEWHQFLEKYLSKVLAPSAPFDNCRLRIERALKSPEGNKPFVMQTEYTVSKPFALAFQRGYNFQSVTLACPEWSRKISKSNEQQAWNVEPIVADAAKEYRRLYRDIEIQMQEQFRPSLLNSDIWNRIGGSLSTVAEFTEYMDFGKPRVRVCIRLPQRAPLAEWRSGPSRWTRAIIPSSWSNVTLYLPELKSFAERLSMSKPRACR